MTEDEIRSQCKHYIENLERWLRRIIEAELSSKFGTNYYENKKKDGIFLFSQKRVNDILLFQKKYPDRCKKFIDATFLDDLIYFICHPETDFIFKSIFSENFISKEHVRCVLEQLLEPRNNLSHSNPISKRQAEKVICYSSDIIDSIKIFYINKNTAMEFNVPRIISMKDSFGSSKDFSIDSNGQNNVFFQNEQKLYLRPGDILEIEIIVDESFKREEYIIQWRSAKSIPNFGNINKISLEIKNHHIAETFSIHCVITSNKDWHRMDQGCDDLLLIFYKVLPN